MAIFTIGDLHFSLGCDKPMDIFPGWGDHVAKVTESWRKNVCDGDTVLLAGDTSWGMTLEQALPDFEYINSLPGKKVIIKGNHDYWWNSRKKMEDFFAKNGLDTLTILHNSFVAAEGIALCGTRGWCIEEAAPQDRKVSAREEGRLKASLEAAAVSGLEPVVFLHYPPVFKDEISGKMIDLMLQYNVKRCFYGHLHGVSCSFALEGGYLGIDFSLISADHLKFCLKRL